MNGDSQLSFHILRVKYLRLCAKNIMNFYRAVFPEKNFLENIHKKRQVLGYLLGLWRYDTYHDTWVTIRYVSRYILYNMLPPKTERD